MSIIVTGESIWFNQWETDQFVEYLAFSRITTSIPHDDANLSWFDSDVETQANNIKNIENLTRTPTESYWRKRYGNASLDEIGNSYLDTVRVEKGDQVLYRKWGATTFWQDAFFAVCLATLGSPADPHPRINLRYIDDNGDSILINGIRPFEGYTSEDDAQGNDLWSNIPPEIGLQ